ncbi:unnamed protein product, partial [Mesorhabditis spiculigera]
MVFATLIRRNITSKQSRLLLQNLCYNTTPNRMAARYLKQEEAQKIDEELFSTYGFKVEQLMELAGLASAQAAHHWAKHLNKGKVLILCGPGNNGGDGFVCARHLQMFGHTPVIIYPKASRNELMGQLVKQCKGMDIEVKEGLPAKNELDQYSFVVDAFFGFSFKPPVREPFDEMIRTIQHSGRPIFSIDIPSGWDVEKGHPSDDTPHFSPSAVISLTTPKMCMEKFEGSHYLGGRFVPKKLITDYKLQLPEYPGTDQFVKL